MAISNHVLYMQKKVKQRSIEQKNPKHQINSLQQHQTNTKTVEDENWVKQRWEKCPLTCERDCCYLIIEVYISGMTHETLEKKLANKRMNDTKKLSY